MEDIKLRYAAVNTMDEVEAAVLKGIEAAKTMKQRVQYAAVALMIGSTFKAEEGADKTPADRAVELANQLVNELGQGVKAEGLVKFLKDKGGFRLNTAGDSFASVKNAQWIRENLEEAKKTPWWSYAPATPFKEYTLTEEIRRIVKTAKAKIKHAEEHPEDAELVHVDTNMINVLEALVGGNPVQTDDAVHLIERIIPHDRGTEQAPEGVAPQVANA
jgi:hypothetical protein